MGCADIIMEAYAMETACLRAKKLADASGEDAAQKYISMRREFSVMMRFNAFEATAKNTLAGFGEGDELRMMLTALKRYTKNNSPINTIAARRRIADKLIEANTYNF